MRSLVRMGLAAFAAAAALIALAPRATADGLFGDDDDDAFACGDDVCARSERCCAVPHADGSCELGCARSSCPDPSCTPSEPPARGRRR